MYRNEHILIQNQILVFHLKQYFFTKNLINSNPLAEVIRQPPTATNNRNPRQLKSTRSKEKNTINLTRTERQRRTCVEITRSVGLVKYGYPTLSDARTGRGNK